MFDKMVKMKNKKGFTLVEMLVVIAVIAILISIMIPVVQGSTIKSKGSTNAANLRSVEGMISTKRVEQPLAFSNVVDQFGTTLGNYLNTLGVGSVISSAVVSIMKNIVEGVNVDGILASDWTPQEVKDIVNSSREYMNYQLYHTTAVDGVLTIPSEPAIVFDNIPVSVECEVGDMVLPEGIQMTVYVTEDDIIATYEYGGNSYAVEDFVQVAETGDYSGTGSGGATNAGVTENFGQSVKCALGDHVYDGTHICPKCLKDWKICEDANSDWYCDHGCGKHIHNACRDGDNNLECDSPECNLGVHSQNNGACIDGFLGTADGWCDVPGCGTEVPHTGAHHAGSDGVCDVTDACKFYYYECPCGGWDGIQSCSCGHSYSHHNGPTSWGNIRPDCTFAEWRAPTA